MSRWPTGTHGSTFGGNPVACAAALATLDVIEHDGLCERARVLGEHAMRSLRDVQHWAPDVVVDVRGVGLMIGVELRDRAAAAAVSRRCLEAELIVLTCGPQDNVLRLAPPLTITDAELDLGLDVLEDAIRSVREQLP
jgi:4-aminobutyrate aminotransferase